MRTNGRRGRQGAGALAAGVLGAGALGAGTLGAGTLGAGSVVGVTVFSTAARADTGATRPAPELEHDVDGRELPFPSGSPGSGNASGSRITWTAPSPCVSEDELRQRVQATVRTELVPRDRRLEGTMESRGGGFVATFAVIEGGQLVGRRVLELASGQCQDATEALELVAAMLLEGGLSQEERAAHREQASGSGETPPTPAPSPTPATPVTPSPVASGPRPALERNFPLRFRATVAAGLGWGMSPNVSPGGFLEFGVRAEPPIWLNFQGGFWGRTWSGPSATGAQVGVSSLVLSASLCAAPEFARLEWGVCAGWGYFSESAEGRGARESVVAAWDQSTLLLALRAGGSLLGPLGWTCQLRFDLPLEQVSYVVETPTEPDAIFLSAAAYASTVVGISATF